MLSTIQYLQFEVPQGSVLGPILFVMYTAELSHVVAHHDLKFHQYAESADDCQIYVSTLVNAVHSAIDRFSCCLEDVEAWTTASRLNASKTQVMWLVNCSRRHIGTRPRRCN